MKKFETLIEFKTFKVLSIDGKIYACHHRDPHGFWFPVKFTAHDEMSDVPLTDETIRFMRRIVNERGESVFPIDFFKDGIHFCNAHALQGEELDQLADCLFEYYYEDLELLTRRAVAKLEEAIYGATCC